jgi:hypothetical protein
MRPLGVTLALGDPRTESALIRLLDEPTFRVSGRACELAGLCASVRELSLTFDDAPRSNAPWWRRLPVGGVGVMR